MENTQEISAGGVIYKKENDEYLFLICKHSGYHKWAFPKGRIEPGEDLEQTALREVSEETGIKANIISKLPIPEKYVYAINGQRVFKTVHYYIMEFISGNIEDHDWEMEDVAWVTYEEAMEKLAFAGAKKTLESAYTILKEH